MLGHEALDHEVRALGVEPDGEPVGGDLDHGVADAVDVVGVVGDLVVGDEEEALVLVLEAEPVFEGARVVAEVEGPGGPHPGQNPPPLPAAVRLAHRRLLARRG